MIAKSELWPFAVSAKEIADKWMKLSGAAAAADPDRARDYDKSYASHFQDMDRGQDQSQQVCLHMICTFASCFYLRLKQSNKGFCF